MATLKFTAFTIRPALSASNDAVLTIDYTYELTLTMTDVQAAAAAHLATLLTPETGWSEANYAAGTVTVAGGGGPAAIPGTAVVNVWGDNSGDWNPNRYLDDDDRMLARQDAHSVPCVPGTQTVTRTFTVASRNPHEDSWSRSEIYLHLTVDVPSIALLAESPVVAGTWAG